jgi:hypothetical protein
MDPVADLAHPVQELAEEAAVARPPAMDSVATVLPPGEGAAADYIDPGPMRKMAQ